MNIVNLLSRDEFVDTFSNIIERTAMVRHHN